MKIRVIIEGKSILYYWLESDGKLRNYISIVDIDIFNGIKPDEKPNFIKFLHPPVISL